MSTFNPLPEPNDPSALLGSDDIWNRPLPVSHIDKAANPDPHDQYLLKADSVSLDIPPATPEADGLMSKEDKTKLDGIIGEGDSFPPNPQVGHLLGVNAALLETWFSPAEVTDSLRQATADVFGTVKPDNKTIVIGADGCLKALGGGGNFSASTADVFDSGLGKSQLEINAAVNQSLGALDTLSTAMSVDLEELGTDFDEVSNALKGKASSQHTHVADDVNGLTATLAGLTETQGTILTGLAGKADKTDIPGLATTSANGLMSAADKNKLDTLSLSGGGGGGGGGAITGELKLWPFRPGSLPAGWHMADGSLHGVDTAVGRALMGLPEEYRTDWRIAESGGMVNVPNLIGDGGGLFLRPIDGVMRQPGSVEGDAMRQIAGDTGTAQFKNNTPVSGPFARDSARTYAVAGTGANTPQLITFDTALSVPTAHEFRPVNIGMTPAIYLGV